MGAHLLSIALGRVGETGSDWHTLYFLNFYIIFLVHCMDALNIGTVRKSILFSTIFNE